MKTQTSHENFAGWLLTCLALALLALSSVCPLRGAGLGGGAGVIGNDSDGSFSRNIDDAQIHGNRFRAPVSMELSEVRARVLELTGTFKCAVYSDTAGVPDRLLRSSVAVVDATNGWNAFPLTAPLDLVGGEFYWLVIWADTLGARVVADTFGTYSVGSYSFVALAGEFPDPIAMTVGTGDAAERTYCIYAEGAPLGIATGPEIDVRGGGKLVASGDVSPTALDGTHFGSVSVGSGFKDSTFTIQNVGDAPLALTGTPAVSIAGPEAGDFSVTSQPVSPVAPGGTATFTVRFDPSARGLRTATVSIANNDSTENPYTFTVQGGGVAAGRESLFPDTKVLGDVNFDGTYYELGTVFHASVPGKVTHLRVYALASESGDHTARLWRNSDDTVIGGPYTWNYGGVTGWIEFDIPDVEIAADTDYTIAISTGTSAKRNYPNMSDLAAGGNNGLHLFYPIDAGKFTESHDARPTSSFNHGDYGRDVLFVPSAPPPESLFPDTKVLGDVNFDGTYYELGTVFRAAVPGKITDLRVYALASESGDHTARLWRNSDEVVIGGPYTWNYGGVTGWIEFDIPDVEIAADTDYTVAISTGTSAKRNYPNMSDMAAGGNNGLNLFYPVDAGKFTETHDARPTSSFNHGDYGRDIVFVPGLDAGDTTYGFEDVTDDFFLIDGIHAGIDFGLGAWSGFRTFAGLSLCATYLTETGVFTLPAGKVLKAIRLSSIDGGTWRVSDGVNPERAGTFGAGASPVWVITDWQTAAANVTVEAGFVPGDGFIDDIVYGDASAIAPVRVLQISADAVTGNVSLSWEGGADRFQVLKSRSIEGPFLPVSGLLSVRQFTDVGALLSGAPERCVAVSVASGFLNRPMANQTDAFTVQYDATPSATPIDSVVGLSSGSQTTFGGFACLTRFNTDGNIDARNGGIYAAASVIPYVAGLTYSFRVVVNIPGHTYSVFVTPAGGTEQTVGADFVFRSEQSTVANLDNWAVITSSATGTNTVCDFTDGIVPQVSNQSFYRVRRL